MGTEQYVQQDWSYATYPVLPAGMIVFVFLAMGAFIVMVNRACQTVGAPARPAERKTAA